MKKQFLIQWIGLILLTGLSLYPLSSQVTIELNLPRVLKSYTEYRFEVKINTNGQAGQEGYEMKLPYGMSLKAEDFADSAFIFQDQTARLITTQPNPGNDATYFFTLKTASKGTYTVQQRLFSPDDPENNDYEMQPYIVSVLESVPPGYSGGGFTMLKMARNSSGAESNNEIPSAASGDENRLQMLQTYIDSKQIGEVGEKELKKASEYYEDANIVLGQAEHITDDEVREKVIRFANAAKKRAEADMEVAYKILKTGEQMQQNSRPAVSDKTGRPGKASEEGVVYRIQLGAFRQSPEKSAFSSVGKVQIVNEDGWHKVLINSYRSKEEALKERETFIYKGFDAFVVTYSNGVRVY